MTDTKSLVAYFSRKGSNYVNGNIVNLKVGNTEIAAKSIQELTGSDLFQISTVKPYPDNYMETTEVAKEELKRSARPELTGSVDGIESYKVIFIGYPNWWGTIPMPVASFLSIHDLTGKTLLPFCTHEGSGLGRSVDDIKKLCPGSEVRNGLAIKGGEVEKAKKELTAWVHENKLIRT